MIYWIKNAFTYQTIVPIERICTRFGTNSALANNLDIQWNPVEIFYYQTTKIFIAFTESIADNFKGAIQHWLIE